ncbi:MAG: Muconolactone delta-isomerase [Thermomicrobiales bacterium]|nr:Muconolactone delta-isomerase [Thermomicrobiales bacterium]
MRFMVRFTIRDPGSEEVASLIPAERDRVRELREQGTLGALYLAADRSGGWIAMQGPSIEWIEAALASLPLHPYMDVELTALLD